MWSLCTTYAGGMASISLSIRTTSSAYPHMRSKYAIQGKSPPQTKPGKRYRLRRQCADEPEQYCGHLLGNLNFCGLQHVDRVVYLSPDVAKALRQWQGLQAAKAQYVFPSRVTCRGKTSLTARQMRNRMACYLKLAGITKAYSPHALRHYLPFLTMSCTISKVWIFQPIR